MRSYIKAHWRWSIIILPLWVAGSSALFTLWLEYPQDVSAVTLRTYPNLFLWPILFLSLCFTLLVLPLSITWNYLFSLGKRGQSLRILFCSMIAIILTAMSVQEWLSNKPAVWEISPSITSRQTSVLSSRGHEPFALDSQVNSLNGLATSIRNQAPANLFINQCRFDGNDIVQYRQSRCFCSPLNRVSTGMECEKIKISWYEMMENYAKNPAFRSNTYYTSRVAFSAMTLLFASSFITLVFMSCFSIQISNKFGSKFVYSRLMIQAVCILCAAWFIMRFYLIYELPAIFPSTPTAMNASTIFSIIALAFIILSAMYAFALKYDTVKTFMETLLIPVIIITSSFIGLSQKDMVFRAFRVVFGIESTPASLMTFFAFVILMCLIPFVYWLRSQLNKPAR